MAKAEFILQATEERHHATELVNMLSLPAPVRCTVSVAFARAAGIQLIAGAIQSLSARPEVYVGIRNDITSIQALRALFALKVKLYVVDTGSRRPIFHPKFYVVTSKSDARVMIGSANLTHYGLQNNIEASALLRLDLKSKDDAAFLAEIFDSLQRMVTDYPEHVLQISTLAQAEQLFKDGRLCDEDIVVAPAASQQAPASGGVQLPRMKLFQKSALPKPKKSPTQQSQINKKTTSALSKTHFLRVWQSKPLMRRDLSIPSGPNSSPTYSMGLKDDVAQKIDRYTYFRNSVFGELTWTPSRTDQELAEAIFTLVVCNEDCGSFKLILSHLSGKKAAKLKAASNLVTEIRWGKEAIPFIAKEELLGRTLSLYKRTTSPPEYLIEID